MTVASPATPSSILQNDGVLGVVVITSVDPDDVNPEVIGSAGAKKFAELGAWALTGFGLAAVDDDCARYVIGKGKTSVLIERAPHGAVALVLVSGHPVVKSAKRMARRLLRSIVKKGVVTPVNLPVEVSSTALAAAASFVEDPSAPTTMNIEHLTVLLEAAEAGP